MPMYDVKCTNSHLTEQFAWRVTELRPCETCAEPVERVLTGSAAVIGDEWAGGGSRTFENIDSVPRTFENRSQWKRFMESRGLVNKVKHEPVPGTDKSPHTSRWV